MLPVAGDCLQPVAPKAFEFVAGLFGRGDRLHGFVIGDSWLVLPFLHLLSTWFISYSEVGMQERQLI